MNSPNDRILAIIRGVGFIVLCALFGLGLAWILVAITTVIFKAHGNEILSNSMPFLVTGGILGLIIGLIIAIRLARAGRQARSDFERKFIGQGRVSSGNTLRIYFGAPFFITVITFPLINRLVPARYVWTTAWAYLGLCLVLLAVSMIVHDHIPKKLIIPIGIIGWILTFLVAVVFGIHITL